MDSGHVKRSSVKAYRAMRSQLTTTEETITQHVRQVFSEQQSAWDEFAKEARAREQGSHRSLALIQRSVGDQSSIIDSRFDRLHGAIDANPVETMALSTTLRTGIAALQRLSKDSRE
jgi:hypothetical protein